MATTIIRITHAKAGADLGNVARLAGMDASRSRELCVALSALFARIAGGMETADVEVQLGGTTAVRAAGTLTLGAVAGAVGGTIGGTLVTVATTGTAANTAGLLAAAINAHATVSKKVYAVAAGNVVTLRAVSPGVLGNGVTLAASGTGMTASGGTLTGGAGDDVIPVSYSRS